jgi:hypothetical protein
MRRTTRHSRTAIGTVGDVSGVMRTDRLPTRSPPAEWLAGVARQVDADGSCAQKWDASDAIRSPSVV